MIIEVVSENPDLRKILKIIKILENDGLIVIPTDTIYAFAVSIKSKKGIRRLASIKNVKLNKAKFSLICKDISHISSFTNQIDRNIFRMMKSNLPGPFTFILKANNSVSKIFDNKRRELGVRVPNHNFVKHLVNELGYPLICSSVNDDDEIIQYSTDPKTIFERHENQVDAVIDCGFGSNVASTIIDCRESEPKIIRQGAGII